MGWFCTTSFGGDAFQMGSVESFFTLLLSPLHLALSLTAWWSPSLSLSFSLPVHTCSHTHSCAHTGVRTHSGNHMHVHMQTRLKDGHRCASECTQRRARTHTHTCKDIQTYWNADQTACGVLLTHFDTCACCVPAHTLTHRRYHTL